MGLVAAAAGVLAAKKLDGAEEDVGVVEDGEDHVEAGDFENVVGDFAVAEVFGNIFDVFYFLVHPKGEDDTDDDA